MSVTQIASGGEYPRSRPAAEQVRDILDAVELDYPVRAAAFAEARAALAGELLPPLDRAYVENQLAAAESYVVEAPGYRGYFPGAGGWHLRQALARLGAVARE